MSSLTFIYNLFIHVFCIFAARRFETILKPFLKNFIAFS